MVKKIQLDTEYSLEIDSLNVTLKYRATESGTKNVKGKIMKVFSKDSWYFPSIKLALLKYLDLSLAKDIEDEPCRDGILKLVENIQNTEERILEVFGEKKYSRVKLIEN